MNDYKKIFSKNLKDIGKLISAPLDTRDIILEALKGIDYSYFKNTEKIKFENAKRMIENISDSSLSDSYKAIYNQICILTVSAASAILEEYFKNYINSNWNKLDLQSNNELDKIKMNLREIAELDFQLKASLGEVILKKDNSINFQDLNSTIRSIKRYLKKDILLQAKTTNNIIFYQQCRHVLVHKGGIVDEEFLDKVGNANKKKYKKNDTIQLDDNDWLDIKNSFLDLVSAIVKI